MTTPIQRTASGVPITDGFDFPVGPRGEGVNVLDTYKVDATLADPNYRKLYNAWHTGEDWNGRGGGDSDLGDPVYAVSHGRVVEFGYYTPSWGNIVLLEHAMTDGSTVWSQYAHLDQIMVNSPGETVTRGQQIGTIGKGEKTPDKPRGRWIAHLHFEIRRNKLPINAWKPYVDDRESVLANYHSPTPFINEYRPHLLTSRTPEIVPTVPQKRTEIVVDTQKTDPQMGSFRKANVEHWYSAPYGYEGSMLWTYAVPEAETNWGEWRPNLPSDGFWEVWVFIPEKQANTESAYYTIDYADGKDIVAVNQAVHANLWFPLGTYPFETGKGYIRLTDVTGEKRRNVMVGFDAVRWVKWEAE